MYSPELRSPAEPPAPYPAAVLKEPRMKRSLLSGRLNRRRVNLVGRYRRPAACRATRH